MKNSFDQLNIDLVDQSPINQNDHIQKTQIVESHRIELAETKARLKLLENRIRELERSIPRKYADVTFLNYKNRKRILVSI